MMKVHRREFVLSLSALAGLASMPRSALAVKVHEQAGFSALKSMGRHAHGKSSAMVSDGKRLSPGQIATLGALAAMIVPADATPSARELGAAEYVAAGLAMVPEAEFAAVSLGLDGVASMSRMLMGKSVDQLNPAELHQLGSAITAREDLLPLWLAVRALTVLFYYAMPQGFSDIGLPGPSIDRGGFPQPSSMACLSSSAF